jgi:hypothetical protein
LKLVPWRPLPSRCHSPHFLSFCNSVVSTRITNSARQIADLSPLGDQECAGGTDVGLGDLLPILAPCGRARNCICFRRGRPSSSAFAGPGTNSRFHAVLWALSPALGDI